MHTHRDVRTRRCRIMEYVYTWRCLIKTLWRATITSDIMSSPWDKKTRLVVMCATAWPFQPSLATQTSQHQRGLFYLMRVRNNWSFLQHGEWKPTIDFNEYTAEAPLFSKANGKAIVSEQPQLGAVSRHDSHVHAVSTMAHTEVEFVVLFTVMYSQQVQTGFIQFRITTTDDVTVKVVE